MVFFLPKVDDDGKFPNWICPGCHLQVESTAQFFELLMVGQEKLRYLIKAEASKNLVNSPAETQSLLRIEVERKLENVTPMFPIEHSLSVECEGLDKPKRKRGRPPRKPKTVEDSIVVEELPPLEPAPIVEESEDELPEGRTRRKRKIKIPTRLQETVQGKELERIYAETGIIDKNERRRDDLYDDKLAGSDGGEKNEVIGHLQSTDGTSLGDLVYIKKGGLKNSKYYSIFPRPCFILNYNFFLCRISQGKNQIHVRHLQQRFFIRVQVHRASGESPECKVRVYLSGTVRKPSTFGRTSGGHQTFG